MNKTILILIILLAFTIPASAEVTLIFTEPLLDGATDMRVFYAANSTLLGSITTNGSELTLDEGQSYIIQVLPTGMSFVNDPIAAFDYVDRGIPSIFMVGLVLFMAFAVVAVAVYSFFKKGKR